MRPPNTLLTVVTQVLMLKPGSKGLASVVANCSDATPKLLISVENAASCAFCTQIEAFRIVPFGFETPPCLTIFSKYTLAKQVQRLAVKRYTMPKGTLCSATLAIVACLLSFELDTCPC